MSIKIIAMDMDGTTLNNAGRISDYTLSVLKEAKACGIKLVVATGRSYHSRPEEVDRVGVFDYMLASNGAMIYNLSTKKSIYENYVKPSNVRYAIDYCIENGYEMEAFIDGQAYMPRKDFDDLVSGGEKYRNIDYVKSTRKPLDNFYKYVLKNDDRVENINVIIKDLSLKPMVTEQLLGLPKATITSSVKNNVEIEGENVSKAEGLKILLGKLGLKRSQLMCFGDASNDICMIEYAGVGVAVGNAWDDVKDAADLIADTNENDGVAKMIERIVFRR